MSEIDIDAYCRRIGYAGRLEPSLETLRALHYHHPVAIPFENLSPLLGLSVPLDLPALMDKLVKQGRGGYCLEQNILFAGVLRQLGFQVEGHAARVSWRANETGLPRTHMVLRVRLGEEYWLADVGFGGLTLTAPLKLEPEVEQPSPHETFMLTREGGLYVLHVRMRQEWKSMYAFDLQPQTQADFEMMNWYVSTHPDSRFVNLLIAARPDPQCRYALENNRFSVYSVDGDVERHSIKDVGEMRSVLKYKFNITIPEHPGLNEALIRVLQGSNGF